MTTIDEYSLTTVPIEQFFNDTSLGNATGFIWEAAGRNYLITNWHVITCRRFPTGENLHKKGGRPNKLRVLFNFITYTFGKQQYDITIRDGDGRPLWFVHPARRVDVVAIPLPLDGSQHVINLYPVNTLSSSNLRFEIGMDVFILGYPFGVPPPGFPVWKRGSIASEPELARSSTDYLLVDTASRSGMSGGPVIRRSWGDHLLEGNAMVTDGTARTKFIGVYSGRLHTTDSSDAQLGRVWPAPFIDEIIACARCDKD